MKVPASVTLSLLLLAPLSSRGADVIISEILAINNSGLTDEDGEDSDWIELTNLSASPVNLDGWHLTDDPMDLERWTFPAVTLNAGARLVVFATSKNRAGITGQLHTNFKLASDGEYLALVRPDGATVEYAFAPAYPPQFPDVSWGAGAPVPQTLALIGPESPLRWKVPADASEDAGGATPWTAPGFNDSAWHPAGMGLAYSTAVDNPYAEFPGTGGDVLSGLYLQNSTIYVRVPFTLPEAATVDSLTLKMRYDDGFAARVNGSAVLASANLPAFGELDFGAAAGAEHPETEATAQQPYELPVNAAALTAGTNVLTIHGLNLSAGDPDFLLDCELSARITPQTGSANLLYFATPTPNAANGTGVTDLGPLITEVTENPDRPDLSSQSTLPITARVAGTQNGVGTVTLVGRVKWNAETRLPMADDGVAPDALAGDGIYSAALPLTGVAAGDMVRWRIEATDNDGTLAKLPFYDDPLNSPQYFGTAAANPAVTSALPVIEWFPQSVSAATTRTGSRCGVLYLGEFYDNVFCRVRGGSSASLSKKSYKLDFNSGYFFRLDPDEDRVEEVNLNTTWTDKAYVRQPLSWEIFDRAGSPGAMCYLARIQQNGAFHSVAAVVEQMDERFLRREAGIDADGALYKMFNTGTTGTSGVEKKTRTFESNADLSAFLSGLASRTGTTLDNFIFDNVDIPRELNYLAAGVLTQNDDNPTKNYFLYRDTLGTGEWTQLAWDLDLTWGSHYMTGDNIAHDGIWATEDYVLGGSAKNVPIAPSHPFVGIQELPPNRNWNRVIDKLLESERFKDMFRRRLRTLMDELLAPPLVEDRLTAMQAALEPDALLDAAKWGQFGTRQTLTQAMDILRNSYLAPRRTHLFTTHLAANAASYPTPQRFSALLPAAQSASPALAFGSYEANPASGNQDEEYLELRNPGTTPVDISGWRLTGGVSHKFLPGTIIESGRSLYVSPRVATFRARTASPKGNQGLNVQGNYNGQLSRRGETVVLADRAGNPVAALTTPADPSPAQAFLRINELHYAPAAGQALEFIELTNTGTAPLDLTGVQFTEGVTLTLTGSLAPGAFAVVVSDPVAFASVYGNGVTILGTYTGALNNGGETITLRDATGETILSFRYDGDWFPPARGAGYSMDLLDATADWRTWDLPQSWGVSRDAGGSPGAANPQPQRTAYAAWQGTHFTAAQIADPAISGPDADASGDGLTNLLLYAAGQDPLIPHAGSLPSLTFDGTVPVLTFPRLRNTADVTLSAQMSTDLTNWSTAGPETVTTNADGTETVTIRLPAASASSPRRYLRLQVLTLTL